MSWLIDPSEQTVFVYLPGQQLAVFDQSEQLLPVPTFAQDVSLTVGGIFSWLLE